jgi:hypothetical protein
MPFGCRVSPLHHEGVREDQGMKKDKKDNTEVMRVRQSVRRNMLPLMICALLAIVGLVGWLTSL